MLFPITGNKKDYVLSLFLQHKYVVSAAPPAVINELDQIHQLFWAEAPCFHNTVQIVCNDKLAGSCNFSISP